MSDEEESEEDFEEDDEGWEEELEEEDEFWVQFSSTYTSVIIEEFIWPVICLQRVDWNWK